MVSPTNHSLWILYYHRNLTLAAISVFFGCKALFHHWIPSSWHSQHGWPFSSSPAPGSPVCGPCASPTAGVLQRSLEMELRLGVEGGAWEVWPLVLPTSWSLCSHHWWRSPIFDVVNPVIWAIPKWVLIMAYIRYCIYHYIPLFWDDLYGSRKKAPSHGWWMGWFMALGLPLKKSRFSSHACFLETMGNP